MSQSLEEYFKDELSSLRELASEFAEAHPDAARGLHIGKFPTYDPHVERLLQGCAFLSARIRKQLDEDLAQVADGLLDAVFPHYLRPIPPLAIAQFRVNPSSLGEERRVPRGFKLWLESKPKSEGRPVRREFHTCYPVDLVGAEIVGASLHAIEPGELKERAGDESNSVFRIRVSLRGDVKVDADHLSRLRIYLNAPDDILPSLHELLVSGVLARNCVRTIGQQGTAMLDAELAIEEVGFADDQGIVDFGPLTHPSYRYLYEYFAFPRKFMFIDVIGLDAVMRTAAAQEYELFFFLNKHRGERCRKVLEGKIKPQYFQLRCTPIACVWHDHMTLTLSAHRWEHRLDPGNADVEVLSVESIDGTTERDGVVKPIECDPLYGSRRVRHSSSERMYWKVRRQQSAVSPDNTMAGAGDQRSELYLSVLADPEAEDFPLKSKLRITAQCTSRESFSYQGINGGKSSHFDPFPGVDAVVCLTEPTSIVRPRLGHDDLLKVISHLTINLGALVHADGSAATLHSLLRLYDFNQRDTIESEIEAIQRFEAQPQAIRPRNSLRDAIAVRGTRITVGINEKAMPGQNGYLFGRILAELLQLAAPLNWFVQTDVMSVKRDSKGRSPGHLIATWKPDIQAHLPI